MDENITQTNTPPTKPMVDVMPTSGPTTITQISYQKKKRTGWIIILIVLILLIAAAVWFFYFHKTHKVLTQTETLQALKASSQPVTTTPAQQAATVQTLSQQSVSRPTTSAQQLDMLNQLSK